MAHGSDACVLLRNIFVDFLVIKTAKRWSDVVLLAHFEVLTEVLVTTPPVRVNHAQTFVTSNLVDVRIAHVVFLPVGWVATILGRELVFAVGLTQSVAPVLNHLLLLVLYHYKQ